MEGTIRVAVCDDAPAVKLFFRQVLEEEGDMEVVSSTSSGRAVLDELGRYRPHALLPVSYTHLTLPTILRV